MHVCPYKSTMRISTNITERALNRGPSLQTILSGVKDLCPDIIACALVMCSISLSGRAARLALPVRPRLCRELWTHTIIVWLPQSTRQAEIDRD